MGSLLSVEQHGPGWDEIINIHPHEWLLIAKEVQRRFEAKYPRPRPNRREHRYYHRIWGEIITDIVAESIRIREFYETMQTGGFLDAFITESKHPECDPSMRFRAVLPSNVAVWRATKEEARRAIVDAIRKRGETNG